MISKSSFGDAGAASAVGAPSPSGVAATVWPVHEISHAKRAVIRLTKYLIVRQRPLLHLPVRSVRLNKLLRLDLFDLRWRPVISVITAKHSQRDLKRGLVPSKRPRFVLSCSETEPSKGSSAFLVELCSCRVQTIAIELTVIPRENINIVKLLERDGEDSDGVVDVAFRVNP